jgi:hypothetical protein
MSDIVERLREQAWRRSGAPKMDAGHTKMLEWEAADEIERLRAANAKAVKALEPFAAKSGTLHSGYDDGIAAGDSPYVSVPVKHLRKAESTLKEIGGAS